MSTISTTGSFIAGAAAACMAVTVTNPLEVVKTRLQLQGELHKSDASAPRLYRNIPQSMLAIYKSEGLRGIQSGLTPAYIYQIFLNGSRLGFYEPCRRIVYGLTGYDVSKRVYPLEIVCGASTGALGAFCGSPFYLIKVRMQSYSPTMAVGEQTYYPNIRTALKDLICKHELYRGVDAACLRTAVGSSVQLPIYHKTSQLIDEMHIMDPKSALRFTTAGLCAGVAVATVMSPPDVIMTRMYNQKGDLYKDVWDCVVKSVRNEGFLALYKGFGANAMRVGPHTILSLLFMEYTMAAMHKIEGVEHALLK